MAHWRSANETSIRNFLTALASADDAHGAVSASAAAGGMGASLLLMIAALPRSDSNDDPTLLVSTTTALTGVQEELLETIETETAVKLFTARNMPHASQVERAARETAIQLALRAAADVPLEVMRLCALGLTHARSVAGRSPRAAFADVKLAIALLQAGFNGARANLEAKLSSLTDALYVTSVVDDMARLGDEATTAVRAAESLVQIPPA